MAGLKIYSGGKKAEIVIKSSLEPATCTICDVPIDPRSSLRPIFLKCLDDAAITSGRRHLPANAASSQGSGKTILLLLNMIWFLENVKNGLAFHVTFNDDQTRLWRGSKGVIESDEDFETAVAVWSPNSGSFILLLFS